MSVSKIISRFSKLTAVAVLSITLYGCSGLTSLRTQGYSIPDSAMQQIRPGQSEDLVIAVLGSPQTRSNFADETAFYYVETKIEQTAFGLTTIKSRTVRSEEHTSELQSH